MQKFLLLKIIFLNKITTYFFDLKVNHPACGSHPKKRKLLRLILPTNYLAQFYGNTFPSSGGMQQAGWFKIFAAGEMIKADSLKLKIVKKGKITNQKQLFKPTQTKNKNPFSVTWGKNHKKSKFFKIFFINVLGVLKGKILKNA